jgi:hypothetical protein
MVRRYGIYCSVSWCIRQRFRAGPASFFLRKSENRDKNIFQYTIGCVRYNVYGENKKKVPNAANNFKGKDIGPYRLHSDCIKNCN